MLQALIMYLQCWDYIKYNVKRQIQRNSLRGFVGKTEGNTKSILDYLFSLFIITFIIFKLMGAKIQGVVSNATNGNVYYSITNHYLKIDTEKITHNTKVNEQIETQLDLAKQQKITLKNKLGHNQGYGLEKNYKGFETKGQILVGPGQYKRQGLLLEESSKDDRRYFTLWYRPCEGEKDIMLIENLEIKSEQDIRQCVWIKQNKVIYSPVAKEPKSFRLAPDNSQYRNYPTTRCCQKCKQSEKCKRNCPEGKEFKGFVENA